MVGVVPPARPAYAQKSPYKLPPGWVAPQGFFAEPGLLDKVVNVTDGSINIDGDRNDGPSYHGWHQELFRRITPEDVIWASEWLSQLSDQQWSDAFRAGGYKPAIADRFIGRLHEKIAEGRRLGEVAAQ